jgi:hypothetical protein
MMCSCYRHSGRSTPAGMSLLHAVKSTKLDSEGSGRRSASRLVVLGPPYHPISQWSRHWEWNVVDSWAQLGMLNSEVVQGRRRKPPESAQKSGVRGSRLQFIFSDVRCSRASGIASAPGADVDWSCCMLVNGDVECGKVSLDARVRMRRCKLTPCSTARVETAIARARWASAKQRVHVLGGFGG